jgi:hypothetical protein
MSSFPPKFFAPLDNSAKALLFSAICFISPSNIVLMLAISCSSRSTRGSGMDQELGSVPKLLCEYVTDLITRISTKKEAGSKFFFLPILIDCYFLRESRH